MIELEMLDRVGMAWAQAQVKAQHYLHAPVDVRSMPEGYAVHVEGVGRIGVLLFGRPEATRCYPFYGSVQDVQSGRCEETRWQVLNLARVWLDPQVQRGGAFYGPEWLPGFVDRRGVWRSTLASSAVGLAVERIGYDYLMRRPPCFLDEPYELRWCLSYCSNWLHKGTLYSASRFGRYRVNKRGLETWRIWLPALTAEQDLDIQRAAEIHPRSKAMRARRESGLAGVQLNFQV